MKETVFIQKNNLRWKEIESIVNNQDNIEPDKVYELYIQLTDDLAYAQTYYKNSKTNFYLNNLAGSVYHVIYKNKKIKKNQFIWFWKYNYPLLAAKYKRFILYSFLVTFVAFIIGFVSAKYDTGFVRLILGDSYVNMTVSNIEKGDPLAVYKSMNNVDSFIAIALNNIYVSFIAFIGGLLFTFGTLWMLITNGIMLGAFLYIFYEKGLLVNALGVVFIHGTLEMFAIIVAGAAGFILGTSFILPGTFKRSVSFLRGTKEGIYLVGGLVPVFLLAAFFEGFVTRYTDMPYFIKAIIIVLSLIFIIFYYFIYPNQLKNKQNG